MKELQLYQIEEVVGGGLWGDIAGGFVKGAVTTATAFSGIGAIAGGVPGAIIGGSVGFVAGGLVNGVVSGINSIRRSNN